MRRVRVAGHACLRNKLDVVNLLIGRNANMDYSLFHAARDGHIKTVKLLLDKKASPHYKGAGGQTPLSIAQQQGHKDIADLLRKVLAQVNFPRLCVCTHLGALRRCSNRKLSVQRRKPRSCRRTRNCSSSSSNMCTRTRSRSRRSRLARKRADCTPS